MYGRPTEKIRKTHTVKSINNRVQLYLKTNNAYKQLLRVVINTGS